MTEEIPFNDVDDYKFPDKYLSELQELDENSPQYDIVQGGFYESLRMDARFDATQALSVSRALNNGDVDEAEDLVYEVLEE